MLSLQGDPKVAALRKKGCPYYDKFRQLLAPTTAIGSLQISSNAPTSDSEEEHALEEELAIEAARTHLSNDNCYTPNMEGKSQDDPPVIEQTQRANKYPIQAIFWSPEGSISPSWIPCRTSSNIINDMLFLHVVLYTILYVSIIAVI